MAKVIGIGGVFFKAQNPAKLSAWYKENLGFEIQDWNGAIFMHSEQTQNTYNVWAPFEENTEHFAPSKQSFMINFIVDNLLDLVTHLKQKNHDISEIESHEQGMFAWIIDPEGNKVELWEPL